MGIYEELQARGLIAQVTNEEEIREMVNAGKATFYIGFDCTAYSLTAYQEQLPQVELIKPDRGRLPPECLTDGPDGKIMNTVERQDGPWGQRYIIKQFTVYAYQELPDGNLFVYEAVSNENPVVRSTTADFLWDGMEVSISLE